MVIFPLFTGFHTGAGGFLLSTVPFPFTTHSPTRYYPCIVHVLHSKTSWWNVGESSSQVMKQVWNHQEDTYSWLFMVQWTMGCLQNDLRFARVGSVWWMFPHQFQACSPAIVVSGASHQVQCRKPQVMETTCKIKYDRSSKGLVTVED